MYDYRRASAEKRRRVRQNRAPSMPDPQVGGARVQISPRADRAGLRFVRYGPAVGARMGQGRARLIDIAHYTTPNTPALLRSPLFIKTQFKSKTCIEGKKKRKTKPLLLVRY